MKNMDIWASHGDICLQSQHLRDWDRTIKGSKPGTRQMVQQLKPGTVLTDDLTAVLRTHDRCLPSTSSCRGSGSLASSSTTLICHVYIQIHMEICNSKQNNSFKFTASLGHTATLSQEKRRGKKNLLKKIVSIRENIQKLIYQYA